MPPPQPAPLVSVIVPTYNRAPFLQRTLDALRSLDAPEGGYEVVVVDDGSADHTPEVLADLPPPLRGIRRENGGPAAARNSGIGAARGNVIAFTDDDCVPEPDWLLRLLERLDDDSIAGAGGRTVPASTGDAVSRFMKRRRISELPPQADGEVQWVVTCNAVMRRHVLDEVGGFDERYAVPGGEDTDLCTRIRARGYRLVVAEKAVINHDHTWRSLGQFAGTWFRYGKGDARHLARDGQPLRPGRLLLNTARQAKGTAAHLVADLRDGVGIVESLRYAGLDLLRRWSQAAGIVVGHRNL